MPPKSHFSWLPEIVDALCDANKTIREMAPRGHPLPSRAVMETVTEQLRSVLFPGYFGISELSTASTRYHIGATLDTVARELSEQVRRGLRFDTESREINLRSQTRDVIQTFFRELPRLQRDCMADVRAAYAGDPALTDLDEAIFCYPGVMAITNYRLAHELHELGVPLLPRMITEQAHSATGIDIHPGAEIGSGLFIDHGTGVVVGETSVIGDRVRVYQGVTLGAKSFPLDDEGNPIKGIPRHPVVEDDVIIYSGATILGRVTIGKGSIIGGNVWLTRSVPPNSRVAQAGPSHRGFVEAGEGI